MKKKPHPNVLIILTKLCFLVGRFGVFIFNTYVIQIIHTYSLSRVAFTKQAYLNSLDSDEDCDFCLLELDFCSLSRFSVQLSGKYVSNDQNGRKNKVKICDYELIICLPWYEGQWNNAKYCSISHTTIIQLKVLIWKGFFITVVFLFHFFAFPLLSSFISWMSEIVNFWAMLRFYIGIWTCIYTRWRFYFS